jgi:hypothetical protein
MLLLSHFRLLCKGFQVSLFRLQFHDQQDSILTFKSLTFSLTLTIYFLLNGQGPAVTLLSALRHPGISIPGPNAFAFALSLQLNFLAGTTIAGSSFD